MITLTNFTDFWRRASVYGGLAIVVVAGLLILSFLTVNIKNSIFPPKETPATVAFGKLPSLDLTDGIKPETPMAFRLETVSGDLPNLTLLAKVFAISSNNSSFGGIEYAKVQAKNLGFTREPLIVSQGFKFVDENDSSKIFSIDSSNGNFLFQTNLQNVTRPTSTQNAVSSARGFFNHFNLNPGEFTDDKIAVSNLKFSGNKLVSAQSILETSLMQVDFYRADIDSLPILPIVDGKSQVSVEYSPQGKPLRIDTVIIAAHHSPDVTHEQIQKDILEQVIKPVCGKWMDKKTKVYVNATGQSNCASA